MNFFELAKKRYSVRKFDSRPVEPELLDQILEAGRIAPTAKNNQPQRIYVVKSEEGLQKIDALTPCRYGAPTVLIFAYSAAEEWKHPSEAGFRSGVEDVSIVASHVMLQAVDLGLGSVWINLFSPAELKKTFSLPTDETPVLLLPVGYPAPDASPSPRHEDRKPLSETVKEL